jgi:hypothetical protein
MFCCREENGWVRVEKLGLRRYPRGRRILHSVTREGIYTIRMPLSGIHPMDHRLYAEIDHDRPVPLSQGFSDGLTVWNRVNRLQ